MKDLTDRMIDRPTLLTIVSALTDVINYAQAAKRQKPAWADALAAARDFAALGGGCSLGQITNDGDVLTSLRIYQPGRPLQKQPVRFLTHTGTRHAEADVLRIARALQRDIVRLPADDQLVALAFAAQDAYLMRPIRLMSGATRSAFSHYVVAGRYYVSTALLIDATGGIVDGNRYEEWTVITDDLLGWKPIIFPVMPAAFTDDLPGWKPIAQ